MKWLLSLLFFAATAHAASYHLPSTTATCAIASQSFSVHIAATEAEREQGFAGASPELIRHSAILFLYPKQGARISGDDFSFGEGSNQPPSASVDWYFNMRHMRAPLDIAFIKSDGTVLTVLRMKPGSKLYRPDGSYAAALEIAAGRAALLDLQPGKKLACHGGKS